MCDHGVALKGLTIVKARHEVREGNKFSDKVGTQSDIFSGTTKKIISTPASRFIIFPQDLPETLWATNILMALEPQMAPSVIHSCTPETMIIGIIFCYYRHQKDFIF